MAEYIEREAAIAVADYAVDEHPYDKDPEKPDTFSPYNMGWHDACDYIRDKLEDSPAADVATVRRGHWNTINQITTGLPWKYRCSDCGCRRNIHIITAPNYGAKMA